MESECMEDDGFTVVKRARKRNLGDDDEAAKDEGTSKRVHGLSSVVSGDKKAWTDRVVDPAVNDVVRPIRSMKSIRDRTINLRMRKRYDFYSRQNILDAIVNVGVRSCYIESVGQMRFNNSWNITLTTDTAFDTLAKLQSLVVDGETAYVNTLSQVSVRGRIHWLPWHINLKDVQDALPTGCNIKGCQNIIVGEGEHEGVFDLVRQVTFTAAKMADIPYSLMVQSPLDDEPVLCLITIRGRKPKCLKCGQIGHVGKNCPKLYCKICDQWGEHNTDGCTFVNTYRNRLLAKMNDGEHNSDDNNNDGDFEDNMDEEHTNVMPGLVEQESFPVKSTGPSSTSNVASWLDSQVIPPGQIPRETPQPERDTSFFLAQDMESDVIKNDKKQKKTKKKKKISYNQPSTSSTSSNYSDRDEQEVENIDNLPVPDRQQKVVHLAKTHSVMPSKPSTMTEKTNPTTPLPVTLSKPTKSPVSNIPTFSPSNTTKPKSSLPKTSPAKHGGLPQTISRPARGKGRGKT